MSNTQDTMTQEQLDALDYLGRTTKETIETVLAAYVEAALWSSTDEHANPLDDEYTTDDIDPETLAVMRADCFSFLSACWGDTWEEFAIDLSAIAPEQLGHDFWLTRNRHGAGFWDRGLGDIGEQLTVLAHSFGEFELIPNGDKVVHN